LLGTLYVRLRLARSGLLVARDRSAERVQRARYPSERRRPHEDGRGAHGTACAPPGPRNPSCLNRLDCADRIFLVPHRQIEGVVARDLRDACVRAALV